MTRTTAAIAAAILATSAASGDAAEALKLGFITTLSGPGAVIGTQMRDALDLAIAERGGKIGGLPVTVVIGDDQQKPDVGRQLVDKFVDLDKVDIVTGVIWSNVMMSIYQPLIKSKTILVSANAGPSPIAGEQCSEYFFSTSWQGDNFSEAMGAYLQKAGTQNLYLMAPNYQAGKDVIAGLKRDYSGSLAGEVYTPLNQLDFAADLATVRAAKPAAIFAFYPGGLGIQFVKQYAQSGLVRDIPVYTAYTIDYTTLPALGYTALGVKSASFWNPDMDNPANRRFVASFRQKYNYIPSEYAAQTYDAISLLDSGIAKVAGKIEDKAALIAALKQADFASVRGPFKFNNNHFPIQDFYMTEVVRDETGGVKIKLGDRVLKDHGDAYAQKCAMK